MEFFTLHLLGKNGRPEYPILMLIITIPNHTIFYFLDPLFFCFAVNGEGTFLSSVHPRTTISTDDDPHAPWTQETHF
jgi:hypothetical protein